MKLRNLSVYKILEIGFEIHRSALLSDLKLGQTKDVSLPQMNLKANRRLNILQSI